ncbi:penicillin-binding protein 2 [uncultured Pseudokineococcus sp.]|uniref:peptidoglycan D,D-transpeptidase FtsI family protein n=1 Tax=uncultured Pseudokineococcus sp. TaxID=1642928 RepID=UPI00260EAD72|nr:penicillin-binding protein 2 [uncultured Pseudokineococcus sp.]
MPGPDRSPHRTPHHPARPLVRHERRARLILALVLALLVVFAGRLVQVQAVDAEAVAQQALADRMGMEQPLLAQRGRILDASGQVLAASVERRDVIADPQIAAEGYEREDADGEVVSEGLDGAVADLAGLLGRDPADVRAALTRGGGTRWSVVARDIPPELWARVKALGVAGITSEPRFSRTYPGGDLAGNVLGYTGGDGDAGLGGVEAVMDDELAGTDGFQRVERGRMGQAIPMGESQRVEPVPGSDVRLTIDRDLQWTAQERATAMREQAGAEWVSVVALEVGTGHVLALAESPTVDPNDFASADPAALGSRAVSDVFEPGSTSKVVTAAAALEEGVVEPLDQFEVPYTWEAANGQSFRDSHHHDLERLTFAGILGESSNTGTVRVGERLTREQRHDYMRRFGFGERTGIELPGETPGILAAADDWDGRQQYTVLFGQGVSVNALQAAEVYATIANDGVRVPPRLVEGTVDPDGTEHPADRPPGVRVVSPGTAQQVSTMLEGVVAEGTGDNAAIPGYRVAGKTGTAEAPDDRGGYTGYTSSFIGYAPADDPQVVVAVIVQRPTNGFYGGQVAAPVFKDVMSYALTARGDLPSSEPARLYPQTW